MTNLILVVDDDRLARMQLCELLETSGYRVIEASNGEEALAIYTQHQPDMVLLDALMSGMDGFTCCAQLQTLPGGSSTPILMITALSDQVSVERAFAAGAVEFITKPVKWPILRQRVRRLLEASQAMQALRQQTEQAQLREMQLRMALEAAQMGAWDWNIQTNKISWSDNLEALFGMEKGIFDGTYAAFINCVHPEDRDLVRRSVREAIEEGAEYDIEFRVVFPDGSIRWAGTKGVVFRDSSGKAVRMCGVDIDITKRKQTEKTLEIHANQQALVAELSQQALAGTDLTSLMQQAVTFVAQVLEVEYCKVLELLPDGNVLLLRAGVGWQPGLVGQATVSASINSQAGYTLVSHDPVIVEDLRTETRFTGSQLLSDHQVISGLSVIIHGKDRPFGVLAAHTTKQRSFSRDNIYFLQAVANVLGTAIERQQTQEALQLSEERLLLALEGSADGLWDWNITTGEVYFSKRWLEMLGYEVGELPGQISTWERLIHPEDKPWVMDVLNAYLQDSSSPYTFDYRVLTKSGEWKWIGNYGKVVVRDQNGNPLRMAGTHKDISDRKQFEEALKQSEARYRTLTEAIPQMIWVADTDGFSYDFNEQCQTYLGMTVEEIQGHGWADAVHPDDVQLAMTLWQEALQNSTPFNAEYRLRRVDGVYRWHLVQALPMRDSENRIAVWIGSCTDIDDLKQAEDELKKMSTALSNAVEGISQIDVQGHYIMVNQAYASAVGYQPEEMIGMPWQQTVYPEDIEMMVAAYQQMLSAGKVEAEARGIRKDGSIFYKQITMIPAYNKQKQLVGHYCFMKDITERKLTEERLYQSEERFQILARATTDVVWDWDLLTDQVWWNENIQRLFGYLANEIGTDIHWWHEHIHPDDRQRIIADIRAVINSKQRFWSNEYRFCRDDGSYAYIFDRGYVVQDSTGQPVRMIGAMMDMSDRKRVQEELQRQNMRSRLFADVTLKIRQSLQINEILHTSVNEVQKLLRADRVLIFRLRPDGSGTVVKEAVVPGIPVLLGRIIIDTCFQESYIDKYRKGRISVIDDITQADIQPCHVEFLQQFAVKANLVVPIIQYNQLWGLLIAHQCYRSRHWDNWETELLRQLADQIGIALAQAKLLEQETRQRQELTRSNEELQEFAFVASHDLQEPLRKIKTFGDRLKATCSHALNEQGQDYLERMQNAAQRMQTLIEDLLSLSRVTTRAQPFVAVDLFQITQEVLSDLEIRIQQTGAQIEVSELPTIHADPLQMRQLLQNLIGNALKFYRPQIPPIVKIYSQTLSALSEDVDVGVEQCQIVIEDNGIGFDEKYLDRIFNVFQRLHGRSEYDGTGIGLAICRKIAERHQGSITARSQLGQGTKFIVALPVHLHS